MRYSLLLALPLLVAASCGSNPGGNRGPIVLGDSASIVTETDSQYLRDDVMDIEPKKVVAEVPVANDTAPAAVAPPKDTVKEQKTQEQKGFAIDFGDSKIIIAGADVRERDRQNPQRDNSLSYTVRGRIDQAKIYVYGLQNVSIRQRYQSTLMLRSSLGTVDLRSIGHYTSPWQNLSVNGQSASLNGLSNVAFMEVSKSKIKSAADRELRKRRTSSRSRQSWMREIDKIRNVRQKPCDPELENVQLQISGVDAKGKKVNKTIRIDA